MWEEQSICFEKQEGKYTRSFLGKNRKERLVFLRVHHPTLVQVYRCINTDWPNKGQIINTYSVTQYEVDFLLLDLETGSFFSFLDVVASLVVVTVSLTHSLTP